MQFKYSSKKKRNMNTKNMRRGEDGRRDGVG